MLAIGLSLIVVPAASAQGGTSSRDAAQANSPLANFTAFNLHNAYTGEVTDADRGLAHGLV